MYSFSFKRWKHYKDDSTENEVFSLNIVSLFSDPNFQSLICRVQLKLSTCVGQGHF